MSPLLKSLEEAYPDDVRVAYRHFPLTEIHDKAQISAEASEAAGAQGKFWEMHDKLYAEFDNWSDLSVDEFRPMLSEFAEQIGLDVKQFDADLDSGKFKAKVQAAREFSVNIGLTGTPFMLVNEVPWQLDYAELENVVPFVKEYGQYPEMAIDTTKEYAATISTDQGNIVIELYPKESPLAVNSFVVLARSGWYDGAPFHRVVDNFVAQASPKGLWASGLGYEYKTETLPDLKYDGPGWVGVARTNDIDTNGGQFFITRTGIAQEQLDALTSGPYTIFGRVTQGQDIVDSLTVRDPQANQDTTPSLIESVTIDEK